MLRVKACFPILIAFFVLGLFFDQRSFAATEAHQFQLGAGLGVFAGSDALDSSFDFDLEPEFFITKKMSASFRLDATAGGVDSVSLGGRFRYYFNFANHPRLSAYVGAGVGIILRSHGDWGDIALPVLGFQYDLTNHIKVGSDISFDIVFDGHHADFGTRLMPIQFKWAF